MKVLHSWLKEYVGEALPDAKTVEELLTFHSFEVEGIEEVAGETVIEVDVLPNRSSDCLSHRGIARELVTLLDMQLANDPLQSDIAKAAGGKKVTVTIEDEAFCSRFSAAVIEGVEVKETPQWLKNRLEALGQRSINNVVDATNYVMFAIGQPTHILDFDKLEQDAEGRVNITVRNGKEGEQLELLGGQVVESNDATLHLVDGNNNTLLDLAGIKGGTAAEFTADSKNVVITSGNFNYQSVRKTAQRTKVFTEASQRFQNEPSPELARYGIDMVATLILDIAGGAFDGIVDSFPVSKENSSVTVTTNKTNALLGLSLTTEEISELIKRTGATVENDGQSLAATGPWERSDLNIEEDFIEEVGRIYGLDKVESIVPNKMLAKQINKRHYYSDLVRRVLLNAGFSEVITTSFHKKGKIQLQNALASDKSYVRGNLRKNIEATLDKNFVHTDVLGLAAVRVFEIGTVFTPGEGMVNEHVSLSIGVRTKGNGYSPKDDNELQMGLTAVATELGTDIEWNIEKGIAEVNFSALVEMLPDPAAYEVFEKSVDAEYKAPSPYPAISRDIALWVEEAADASMVESALSDAAGPLLCRIDLFDTFTKDGRTSYAFRLVFVSSEKTLTDEEINSLMEAVNEICAQNGWEVR